MGWLRPLCAHARQALHSGIKFEEIKSGPGGKLSIAQWKNKVVGAACSRRVRYCAQDGGSAPLSDEATTAELQARRGVWVELKPGTILLVAPDGCRPTEDLGAGRRGKAQTQIDQVGALPN